LIEAIVFQMLLARHNRVGSARPFFSVRQTTTTIIRHISDDRRANLLSKHLELSEQKARKRVVEQYIYRCAVLSLNHNVELGKVRLPVSQLEQFVRLRFEALAARLLEGESSEKLSRQYEQCQDRLELANIISKNEELYNIERNAVLKLFPKLALPFMRENILKQYERIMAPRNEEETADQPRAFVAGTTREEKRHFYDLALQYVAIHMIGNPITSKGALEAWKADFKRCQDTLAKTEELTIEEERAEALEKYPDLKDLETCRTVVDNYHHRSSELAKAQEQGVKIPSAQFPPKKLENYLQLRLKAIHANICLPYGDTAQNRKKRHEMRKECLAHLDEVQTYMKQSRGGWWIIPNPFSIIEGLASIF
jgi:hypothetical protein